MQRKTVGILFIVVPLPLLFVTLSAYAIASFVIASVVSANGGDGAGTATTIGQLIRVLLGFVGLLSVVGMLVGLPLGIYLIVTGDKHKAIAVPPQPPTPLAQ